MAEKSQNGDYEAQFFEFSPSAFFEEVKAIISDRLCEGIDQVEEHLKKIPERVITKDAVTQGAEKLRQHTDNNFTKIIQKLESHILGNIMKIPPHILLPNDVEQATQVSASDVNLLQAEIDSLHMQLKNEKYMQAKYREELEEISNVLEHQEKFKGTLPSDSQIAYAEDLKEKLMFIKANGAETEAASAKTEEALRNLSLQNVPTPSQLLALEAMK